MAYGNCHWLTIRAPNRWSRGFLVAGCVLCLVSATSNLANGAPVTFQFVAEVAGEYSSNGGANLPFDVSAGETIVGTFTFEPTANGPHYFQPHNLRFDIAGQVINASAYLISVHDESIPNAAPISGTVADPLNTPVVDQSPGSSDDIFITCPTPQGSFCGMLSGSDRLSVRPMIAFSTDSEVLNSNNLIADLNSWNSFTFREMSLLFRDSSTGGETYVGAYIGAVQSVPEPTSALLTLLSATAALVYRRTLSRPRVE